MLLATPRSNSVALMLLGQNVVGLEVLTGLSTNNERYEFVEDWKASNRSFVRGILWRVLFRERVDNPRSKEKRIFMWFINGLLITSTVCHPSVYTSELLVTSEYPASVSSDDVPNEFFIMDFILPCILTAITIPQCTSDCSSNRDKS